MKVIKYTYPLIDFGVLSLLFVVSLILAIFAYSFGGVDFNVYYAAGRVFLHGGNPYDFSQLAGEIVSSTGEMNNPYYYAPWFTWVVAPLALLTYESARIIWAVINYIVWFWGLLNLSKLIDWPLIGWRRWGIYLFVTFLFAWATWGSEQVGILIFLILTAVLLSFKHEKFALMGIWMALLLFKPNVTALPVMALVVWLIFQGKWKPVLSMSGLLILMTIVSLLVSPGWYLALLQPDKITGLSYTLDEAGAVQIHRYATTLLDWLSIYGFDGRIAYLIYAIVVLIGIFLLGRLIWRTGSIVQLMAITILINFALIPYTLFYDYPLLLLTVFYVNSNLSETPGRAWVQGIMNTLMLLSLFVGSNISYRYWIIVILSFFAIYSKLAAPSQIIELKANE